MHGEAPKDGQSLKLKWMKFDWLSFVVRQVNQASCPTIKHAAHNRVRKSRQHLKFQSYRYQLLLQGIAQGKEDLYKLQCVFLSGTADETFTSKIVFNDKSLLHLSGNISHNNLRI
jgi:hypothetical protein